MIGGAVVSAIFMAGILCVAYAVRYPRPRLEQRVIPYTDEGWKPIRRTMPVRLIAHLFALAEKVGSTSASVKRRTDSLGTLSVRDFRIRQSEWAGLGLIVSLVLSFVAIRYGAPLFIVLIFIALGVFGPLLGADAYLTHQVTKRSQHMTQELPDIVDLLALSVGAGLSIRGALEHIENIGCGALGEEIGRTLDDVRSGSSLEESLNDMAQRCANPAVERFVEALIVSLRRGTSLAEVLRTQAADARESARRELLEEGGRKEIRMLIPVVFLIMPVTILFTLYPSVKAISLVP
ncbi:MAG: type II secretion system F family protein [Actinomycetaceae bacterium]|nr:type II secretion system F family protein [Actinomycetaceae bacterium]